MTTTTLNDTLSNLFTTLNDAVNAAQAARVEAHAKADAEFDKVDKRETAKFHKALAKAAEAHFTAGGTLDEFAEAYGKSTVTTRNHLKAIGVEVPAGKKGARSKFTDEKKTEIATAWLAGDKRARMELALANDVTEATMRNWAIEHGLHEPVKREAKATELVDA